MLLVLVELWCVTFCVFWLVIVLTCFVVFINDLGAHWFVVCCVRLFVCCADIGLLCVDVVYVCLECGCIAYGVIVMFLSDTTFACFYY